MYFGKVAFEELDLDQMVQQRQADARRLDEVVGRSAGRLASLDEEAVREPRGPGRWSRKQVLGHLVDSAWNNHERLVRVALGGRGDLPGYDQEQWVAIQGYQEVPWTELVELWTAANRHLARFVRRIPDERLAARCNIGGSDPVCLLFVIHDYLTHLEHHLRQVLEGPDAE